MRYYHLLDIITRYAQLIVGTVLGSLSVVLFLVPASVVPQGVTGVATLLNAVVGLPIGVTVLILNIPILYLGYRMLPGGWRVTADTLLVVVMFSVMVDFLIPMVPPTGISEDRFLNAVWAVFWRVLAAGLCSAPVRTAAAHRRWR